MNLEALRGHGASVLVATVSSTFGVLLLQVIAALGVAIRADDVTGSSGTAMLMLGICATVFMVIAIYVSAIVTSNTFATIVAGRTRTIALMRLIGASAGSQRRAVAREGFLVGVIGAAAGAVVGTLIAVGLVRVAVIADALPALDYSYFDVSLLLPVVAVVVTTTLAAWVGSRRVLVVSPMQAIGGSTQRSLEEVSSRGRTISSVVLMVLGFSLLAGGVALGLVSPFGILIAMMGGVISFTGLVLGSHLFMPAALRLVGRMLGRSAPAKLAAENALRYPERSSRTTIGIVIGVTLITMFAVAMQTFRSMILTVQEMNPVELAGINAMLDAVVLIFTVLIGFSALIAAIGMVNNLSLSVLQRTRELGLLRALGFTAHQVRAMILAESAQLTFSAVIVGVLLGIGYGWAGAQSLLGGMPGIQSIVAPVVPWPLVVAVAAAAAMLTWAASVAPARRAMTLSPVAALAND